MPDFTPSSLRVELGKLSQSILDFQCLPAAGIIIDRAHLNLRFTLKPPESRLHRGRDLRSGSG
jgi:hypothetical protein